ncbi:hypothetical protein HCA83_11050 [Listeria innocua]|uniref:hypothetical protein n=1 Tax=Listeria innocua TaxID=1642 RepID=UPI001623C34A|nr:hypothetical protein [Listeria innocua]MBC2137068.1 hypothetical protein [Listeria innocua]MBC2145777.1 hypothetical protein [Listeria innocua]
MGIQEIENKINEVVSLIRYEENRIERDKYSQNLYGLNELLYNYYKELDELREKPNELLKGQ